MSKKDKVAELKADKAEIRLDYTESVNRLDAQIAGLEHELEITKDANSKLMASVREQTEFVKVLREQLSAAQEKVSYYEYVLDGHYDGNPKTFEQWYRDQGFVGATRILYRYQVDRDDIRGEFWIEEDRSGASLFIKGTNLDENGVERSVLGIDLYYGAPENECPHSLRPIAQLVLDSSTDDPIGHVRLFARAVGLNLDPMLARSGDLIGNDADVEEINRLRLLKTAKRKE